MCAKRKENKNIIFFFHIELCFLKYWEFNYKDPEVLTETEVLTDHVT